MPKRKPTQPKAEPDREARAAAMLGRLRASGLKLTPQRLAIVRELCADPTHPTAQELYERLRPAMPTMSFATVYNTLDALASAGLCGALALSPGAARFDPNMDPHHHAVCDRCGMVRDVPVLGRDRRGGARASEVNAPAARRKAAGPASAAVEGISSAPGFQVRAVEWIYRGLCAECAGSSSARSAARPPI